MNELEKSTYCLYPWFHQRVGSDGFVTPCCSWSDDDINKMHHSSAFSSPWMDQLRHDMQIFKPPKGCQLCIRGDEIGRKGGRQCSFIDAAMCGAQPHAKKLVSHEIDFSNKCNLRCRTCSSARSTKWYQDDMALGRPVTRHQESLWSLSPSTARDARQLVFLGGEPMLHQDLIIDNLRMVQNHGDISALRVNVVTNCTIPLSSDLRHLLERCGEVNISCSIDAYGALNDYIRTDSHWEQISTNLQILQEWQRHHAHVWIVIDSVLSIYNCNQFDGLLHWMRHDLDMPVHHLGIIMCWWPSQCNAANLPSKYKDILTKRWQTWISEFGDPKGDFIAAVNHINSAAPLAQDQWLTSYRQFNGTLDARRHTDLRDANPEIAAWLAECGL